MTRNTMLAIALTALFIPSAAIAKDKPVKPAHGKSKPANFVFKGAWHTDGTVTVSGGNARVRKHGFVGLVVGFDLTTAKLRASDTNADGLATADDLVEGDKVVVKARLARTEPGAGPFAAHRLVDQTHPAVVEEAAQA